MRVVTTITVLYVDVEDVGLSLLKEHGTTLLAWINAASLGLSRYKMPSPTATYMDHCRSLVPGGTIADWLLCIAGLRLEQCTSTRTELRLQNPRLLALVNVFNFLL